MLIFRFRKSRSADLPWLLTLAKQGQFKELALSPTLTVYETAFEVTDPLQLPTAISLATALGPIKTAEAFINGQSIKLTMVREVLRCYQQSHQVEDAHAYCWFATAAPVRQMVSTFPSDALQPTLLFPCRLAAPRAYGIHRTQPGTFRQQVESALVRAGVQWCPRLADLTDWQDEVTKVTKETL